MHRSIGLNVGSASYPVPGQVAVTLLASICHRERGIVILSSQGPLRGK